MIDYLTLKQEIAAGNFVALARALSLVENEIAPADALLKSLNVRKDIALIGITGPPGAGKSTLVSVLLDKFRAQNKRIAVLAVDPSSPFNLGSLLGDRIRMSKHFNDPQIFIRSIASRGSLGGLSAKTIELIDVMRSSIFDVILVETVGVGQSEVEIAGLADKTLVVLVPEAGDEIQQLKSGIMEVAQVFVVNKADRPGAEQLQNNLKKMLHGKASEVPVFLTNAEKAEGIDELANYLVNTQHTNPVRKNYLLAEHAYRLIQHKRMKSVNRAELIKSIEVAQQEADFNIYRFIENWDKDRS
jgi:LAO/AO transport system kinase